MSDADALVYAEKEIERLNKQIELEQQYSEDLLLKGAELEARIAELGEKAALRDCVDYFDGLRVNGIDDEIEAATFAAEGARKALKDTEVET